MPHYRDGTEAKVGDVVKGQGYNVKGGVVGTVVGLVPGSESCNIQVAYLCHGDVPVTSRATYHRMYHTVQLGVLGCGAQGGEPASPVGAWVELEYGVCKAFELVQRKE